VLIGTLTLLVSRRRSKKAAGVSLALYILSLFVFLFAIIRGVLVGSHVNVTMADTTVTALHFIGQGVAYSLLFTPSARHWMSREDEKNEKAA
jgi:ABC-type transport system involved in multi-copper enzyme maturation permease subunit